MSLGFYNVTFSRNGYQAITVSDTTAVEGYSTLNVTLSGFYFIAGRVFAGEIPVTSGFAYGYKMQEGDVVDIYADMIGELGMVRIQRFIIGTVYYQSRT